MKNLNKYREIMEKYRNGEYGCEHLHLNEILARAGEPDLLRQMNSEELDELINTSFGMHKKLFIEYKKSLTTKPTEGLYMEQTVITETKAAELRREVQELEEKILEANGAHGQAAQEEGGLFRNPASHTISQDIARWTIEKNRILDILSSATIVKIDMQSEEMKVEVGDVALVQITYEGEEPEEFKVQIDGTMKLPGVTKVTFASPMGKALLGKKIGESFALRKSAESPVNADGTVVNIVKAKDLGSSIEETEAKKPYTLEKHS